MNTRIKHLRKDILKITQDKFSETILLKRNTIALIETGKNTLTDRTISDICREFNVNEKWLRTGCGEVFIEQSTEELDILARRYNLDDRSKSIVEAFLELSVEDKQTMANFLENIKIKELAKLKIFDKIQNERVEEAPIIFLPIYEDIKASAGLGSYVNETKPTIRKFNTGDVPSKADHGIYIKGDSMEPLIKNGELIFIQPQPSINFGEIGIFVYNEEVFCKRLVKEDKKIILRSENDIYKDIVVEKTIPLITVGKVLL